jgi:hypothetical protein
LTGPEVSGYDPQEKGLACTIPAQNHPILMVMDCPVDVFQKGTVPPEADVSQFNYNPVSVYAWKGGDWHVGFGLTQE